MEIYYVYILECRNKKGDISLYTGSTQDLVKRIHQHSTGKGARYTKGKEIKLAYFETYTTRSEAMKREYALKKMPVEKKWELVHNFNQKNQND